MKDKLIKWVVIATIVGSLLWAFDYGMKRQHEIDCAHGRYCDV